MNPRNLNRHIHAACLKVMEASCLVNDVQREAALSDLLPSITELIEQIEGSHADEVLSRPALITYGWLHNQHKEILESLVLGADLDSFIADIEEFANE